MDEAGMPTWNGDILLREANSNKITFLNWAQACVTSPTSATPIEAR
jgi:hypothetical protein